LGNRFFWWMGNRLLIQILLINAFGPFGGFEGLDSSCLFYVGTQNKSHSKQVICLLKVVTCFDNSTHCRDWKNLRALHWTIVQNRLAVLNCFTTGSACFLFLAWV
jgi:hypothetical protein